MPAQWRRIVELWESTQVELHGRYSTERVQALAKYSEEASWFRVVTVLVVTPLPCLVMTMIPDLLPLDDPTKGLEVNNMFFVREFYTFMVMTYLTIHQFRMEVPVLPYPRKKELLNTVLVLAISVGIMYAFCLAIGFPLPFSLMTMTSPLVTLISITMVIEWVKKIREKPETLTMVINSFKLWLCEVLLVFTYPPYFYVFTTLSHVGQMAFTMLLPVIKLFMRNVFARTVVHHGDAMPETIVFSVDVFNALFLSYCMQNSPSIWTTVEVMIADILLLTASLHDTEADRLRLMELERQVELQTIWKRFRGRTRRDRADQVPTGTLKRASILLEQEPQLILPAPVELRRSSSTGNKENSTSGPIAVSSKAPRKTSLQSVKQLLNAGKVHPTKQNLPKAPAARLYIRKVQRLLYMAEFLLLLNYVEVVIPLVFSIYMAAMHRLPNREYYAQIAGLDKDQLLHTLKNVLFYCALQVISLLLVFLVLYRKLGLSPAHQLAFVLEKQYNGVQTKLCFWVYYNVQASLKHQGYDYTFRFPWLDH